MSQFTKMTQAEKDFLRHVQMWGSAGYPVQKAAKRWIWIEFWGVKGAPTVYKTKREAVAAIERYIEILLEKAGAEAHERALAELAEAA